MKPVTNSKAESGPGYDDLLSAETTLRQLTEKMAAECQAGMETWPRDWMQKHVNERAAINKARLILLDRAEAETRKPCRDQGDGFWDCSPRNACVNPQCANCPQRNPT